MKSFLILSFACSDAYAKNFPTEESPSGMVARSGTYQVRSRVTDDDKEVYAGTFLSITCISIAGGY